MVSHPNRSKKNPKRGRNPTPEEIVNARKKLGITQATAGKLVYKTESGWKKWELGLRRMPPDTWELFLIKTDTRHHKKMMEETDLSTPDAAANETGESGKRGG